MTHVLLYVVIIVLPSGINIYSLFSDTQNNNILDIKKKNT